jgi:hypothetical protein
VNSLLHILRTRPVLIAGAFYLLLSLACTQVPLLNYLGFEFAFVMGLAATGVAATLAIVLVRRARPELLRAGRARAWRFLGLLLLINLLLLGLPLLVMAASALVVRNCDFLEGLAFFALLPGVTAAFASCLGFFLGLWFRHPRIVLAAIVLLSCAYAALIGFTTPAVFSYNLFYGFFPGLTYDELLPVTGTLILWRLVTLLACAIPVAGAMLLRVHAPQTRTGWDVVVHLAEILVRPAIRWWTAGTVLALALLYLARCELGFETTASHLRAELPGRIVTQHFVIHLAGDDLESRERASIAAEHEFRLAQVLEAFSLQDEPLIESFLYPSVDERRRLIGAGTTSIAKPWQREIHLLQESYAEVLKHELVHVVAGRFSPTIIRASFSTGLVEGLAMAVEWDWGNRTLHQYAAALQTAGLAPNIRSLMGFAGFARQAPSVSYVLAGSFCRYLIDRHGMRTMVALYGGSSIEELTGGSLDSLIGQWRLFLDGIPVTESDREAVEVFFRTPPVFDRVCARVVARWNREARQALEAGNLQEAAARSWVAFREAGGYAAFAIHLRSLYLSGAYAHLVELADSVREHSARPGQFLPLDLLSADACWMLGARTRAESLYAHLLRVDLSPALTEASVLRLMAVRDPREPAGLGALLVVQRGDSARRVLADSLVRAVPESRVAPYVLARIMARSGEREDALAMLLRINPGPPAFEAARLRCAAELMVALGRYDQARTTFWLSLNADDAPKSRDRVTDWIDRCEWMKTHDF